MIRLLDRDRASREDERKKGREDKSRMTGLVLSPASFILTPIQRKDIQCHGVTRSGRRPFSYEDACSEYCVMPSSLTVTEHVCTVPM